MNFFTLAHLVAESGFPSTSAAILFRSSETEILLHMMKQYTCTYHYQCIIVIWVIYFISNYSQKIDSGHAHCKILHKYFIFWVQYAFQPHRRINVHKLTTPIKEVRAHWWLPHHSTLDLQNSVSSQLCKSSEQRVESKRNKYRGRPANP